MAVVNFTSNELSLLSDTTVLRQTKYTSQNDEFTGLSVVNLSDTNTANIAITLLTSSGSKQVDRNGTPNDASDDLVNPITVQLAPNAQRSVDIAQLFSLDTDDANQGRLLIESDQPVIAGFSASGRIRSDFFDTYLRSMIGIPLYPDYRESLHDFIVPEIPQDSDASVQLNFVNPNYNTSYYDVTHYATDGTVMRSSINQTIAGSGLEAKSVPDFVADLIAGRVIVAGGYDSGDTSNKAYLYSSAAGTFH